MVTEFSIGLISKLIYPHSRHMQAQNASIQCQKELEEAREACEKARSNYQTKESTLSKVTLIIFVFQRLLFAINVIL